MAITIQCDCGKKLQAPESLAGKRVKCPSCTQPLQIPAATVDDDPLGLGDVAGLESAANPLGITKPIPAQTAAPESTSARPAGAPPRGRKKTGKSKAKANAELTRAGGMVAGGLALAIAGIIASVISYNAAAEGEVYYMMTGLIFGGVITFLYGLMALVRAWNYRSGNVSESGEAGIDRFARNLSFLPVLIISIVVVLGGGLVLLLIFG